MFVHCRAERIPCMRRWRSNPYRRLCSERLSTIFQRARVPPSDSSPGFSVVGAVRQSRTRITEVWRTTGVIKPVPRWSFQQIVRSDSDFNIHVKDHGNSDATLFADRLASLTSCSTYTGATHKFGGTLIITGTDVVIESVEIDPPSIISDHGLMSCCIPIRFHPIRSSNKFVRNWRGVARPTLFEAIRNSHIGGPPTSLEPDHLLAVYHSRLNDIADRFAPLRSTQDMSTVNMVGCRLQIHPQELQTDE